MSLKTAGAMTMILLLSMSCMAFAAPIELVRSSGTNHVIYHQADAPPSVAMAAMELQEYLYKVAGAKLAILPVREIWASGSL